MPELRQARDRFRRLSMSGVRVDRRRGGDGPGVHAVASSREDRRSARGGHRNGNGEAVPLSRAGGSRGEMTESVAAPKWSAVVVACSGAFVTALSTTLVAVAAPSIARDLHA